MKQRVIPILAYHSWRFSSSNYVDNDHVALFEDLQLIDSLGIKVVPLSVALSEVQRPGIRHPLVALTFDDGAIYDYKKVSSMLPDSPSGFYNILQQHRQKKRRFRVVQPWLHATSFVIASAAAHEQINNGHSEEFDWIPRDAWSDKWWAACADSDLLSIGNHSWDHNHPNVDTVIDSPSGDFFCVDNLDYAEREIADAQRHLQTGYGITSPYFAYPWGQCSDYLGDEYFPTRADSLGIKAAFTTEPDYLRRHSNIWRVPRFVCGEQWQNTSELEKILSAAS